jgi:hypothetical protein
MTLAYRDVPAESLPTSGTTDERRSQMFATYVEAMFARRSVDTRYTKQQTLHWLGWLANALSQQAQTVFYLERLQPDWLPTPALRLRYTLIDRLGSALGVGLIVALVAGLGSGLLVGLAFGPAGALFGGTGNTQSGYPQQLWSMVRNAVLGWLVGGLVGGLVGALGGRLSVGLIAGLAGGLVGGPAVGPRRIAVVETVRWSGSRALSSAIGGIVLGVLGGGLFGLLIALAFGGLFTLVGLLLVLAYGLTLGLPFALVLGLIGGLTGREVEAKVSPNQGIRRSGRTAILIALLFGLGAGLLLGLGSGLLFGLLFGLVVGLVGGLNYGGYACLSHFGLRFVLWRAGALPLDTIHFLDYATERILVRKVGGGYIFVQRLLQEYFATLLPRPQPDTSHAHPPV